MPNLLIIIKLLQVSFYSYDIILYILKKTDRFFIHIVRHNKAYYLIYLYIIEYFPSSVGNFFFFFYS